MLEPWNVGRYGMEWYIVLALGLVLERPPSAREAARLLNEWVLVRFFYKQRVLYYTHTMHQSRAQRPKICSGSSQFTYGLYVVD